MNDTSSQSVRIAFEASKDTCCVSVPAFSLLKLSLLPAFGLQIDRNAKIAEVDVTNTTA